MPLLDVLPPLAVLPPQAPSQPALVATEPAAPDAPAAPTTTRRERKALIVRLLACVWDFSAGCLLYIVLLTVTASCFCAISVSALCLPTYFRSEHAEPLSCFIVVLNASRLHAVPLAGARGDRRLAYRAVQAPNLSAACWCRGEC